ncbi:MAG: hypothetical protein M1825_004579 [Sarcosagium campestre]|nr:MAG: hypothetical protein M1825_004579 [Sarcosagium campestre]
MSYSYERIERRGTRQQRSTFGYWVPLFVTVTVAAAGVAAWIWSERGDEDEDAYDYGGGEDHQDGPPPPAGPPPGPADQGPGYGPEFGPVPGPESQTGPSGVGAAAAYYGTGAQARGGDSTEGVVSRMSGALRRTPSPQQIFDGATKRVAAGVAAAGAVVGGALSSIREEDRDDYRDHATWSDVGARREDRPGRDTSSHTATAALASGIDGGHSVSRYGSAKRKTVAVVVSAESNLGHHDSESDDQPGDATLVQSILAHLPGHINHATTRLFVLIYAPDLKQHPASASDGNRASGSVASSFSNIGHDDANAGLEESGSALASIDPNPIASPPSGADTPKTIGLPAGASPAFTTIYTQAQAIVEKSSMILPFTTQSGHVHILRHLAPEAVYIQESLCGQDGDAVTHLSSWVGQIVVIVGAEGGHGGLVDSEDESGHAGDDGTKQEQWWQRPERVGLGKGVELVEGMRVGEDWRRRIGGAD